MIINIVHPEEEEIVTSVIESCELLFTVYGNHGRLAGWSYSSATGNPIFVPVGSDIVDIYMANKNGYTVLVAGLVDIPMVDDVLVLCDEQIYFPHSNLVVVNGKEMVEVVLELM